MIEPGPGRQRELPAGFFDAVPGRDRVTATRQPVFGGFEDLIGADRMKKFEDASAAKLNWAGLIASDRFVPRYPMRVNFRPS